MSRLGEYGWIFTEMRNLDRVPEGYEAHHIVLLYVGGADTPENLILDRTP